MVAATLYTDPACPWAYSANPALRVLEWRFGDQLDWRLVMIGLREEANQAGFDAARRAVGHAYWRGGPGVWGAPLGLAVGARPEGGGGGAGPRLPRRGGRGPARAGPRVGGIARV